MKITIKNCLKIGITVLLIYLFIHFFPTLASIISKIISAASPLILGFGIAYLINILMSFYENHYFPKSKKKAVITTRRPICVIASYITMLGIIALIIGLIIPQLISCVQVILEEAPEYISSVVKKIADFKWLPEAVAKELLSLDWKESINSLISAVTSGIGGVMGTVIKTVTSVFSGFITLFIGIVFSVYLLLGKDRLISQTKKVAQRYMKPIIYKRADYLLKVFNESFHRYIVGQCLEAVILGVLCTIGMLILRIPYATMIGAFIAFTALIPIAGAYIGAAVGAFMILTQSPVKALVFLIFLIVLQQFEGNIIYPRVVGTSLGLPAIWVLAAVTVGGGLMGIPGMLLGVPTAAALYTILKDDMKEPKLRKIRRAYSSASSEKQDIN